MSALKTNGDLVVVQYVRKETDFRADITEASLSNSTKGKYTHCWTRR